MHFGNAAITTNKKHNLKKFKNMNSSKIETGIQLFSRLSQRPTLENINPKLIPNGPYPNEFIEITGAPGTGKTTVLMDFIVRTLLQSNLRETNCGAILIDIEHKFDMFRLLSLMEYELKARNVERSRLQNTIDDCLKNLIVLNCYDREQLQLTFYNLEQILTDNPQVALIAVDSVPAYYWQYRNSTSERVTIHGYTKHMLQFLEERVSNSNVVVVYTHNADDSKAIQLKETTYRILLEKKSGASYARIDNREIGFSLGKTLAWL